MHRHVQCLQCRAAISMTASEQPGDPGSEPEPKAPKRPRPDDLRNLLLGRGSRRSEEPPAGGGAPPDGPDSQERGWGSSREAPPASVEGDWVQPRRRGDDDDREGGDDSAGSASDAGWTTSGRRRDAVADDEDASPEPRGDDRAASTGPSARPEDSGAGAGSGDRPAGRRPYSSPRAADDRRGAFGSGATHAPVELEYESCEHCGAVLDDDSDYCPSCGRLADADDVVGGGTSGAGAGSDSDAAGSGFRRFSFGRAAAPTSVAMGQPASHLRRLGAFFIDGLVVFVILSVVYPRITGDPYIDFDAISEWVDQTTARLESQAQGNEASANEDGIGIPRSAFTGLSIVEIVLRLLYQGVLLGAVGYTVGKRVMGIAVVNSNGAPIGIPLGVVRSIGFVLSMQLPIVMLVILVHPQRRALHDIICGAYPVQAEATTQTIDEV